MENVQLEENIFEIITKHWAGKTLIFPNPNSIKNVIISEDKVRELIKNAIKESNG